MTLFQLRSTGNRAARFVDRCLGLGFIVAVTLGCGLDDELLLRTTDPVTVGGAGSTFGGSAGAAAERPSPFCDFKWGRSFAGTSDVVLSSGNLAYPTGLGMLSVWFGYETDNKLNYQVENLLYALSPGGDAALQGVIPVLYGYFIPFKAAAEISKDCAPDSTTANICTEGAVWLRANRDNLRTIYANYATQVANIWGVEAPLIWLFEPDFQNYARASQSDPLSLDELGIVASDLIGQIKARLPNAIISHFASPEIADFGDYFGHFDLSLVALLNGTGTAQFDYFRSGNSANNPSATYLSAHEATGLPIFVDTGFVDSDVTKYASTSGWLTESVDVLNARIADGVVAVHIGTATSDMQTRIDEASLLTPLNCAMP